MLFSAGSLVHKVDLPGLSIIIQVCVRVCVYVGAFVCVAAAQCGMSHTYIVSVGLPKLKSVLQACTCACEV